jgi:hypothetical protein
VIAVFDRLRYRTPGQPSEMYLIDSSCIRKKQKEESYQTLTGFAILHYFSIISPSCPTSIYIYDFDSSSSLIPVEIQVRS